MDQKEQIKEGQRISGPLFNEPMRVETSRIVGPNMRVVMEHEQAQGRQVYDVHEKNLGDDITRLDLNSGELRLIEVKGLAASTGTIMLTPNERRVAEDRRDCCWLYVVTDCGSTPRLQEPICDPARFEWNEVTKLSHYYLTVDALTQAMQVCEGQALYGTASDFKVPGESGGFCEASPVEVNAP